VGAAAIQAHQELRKYPDPGLVRIVEAGALDDHLRAEFCLINRLASLAGHKDLL